MREKKRSEATGLGFTEIQLNEGEHAAAHQRGRGGKKMETGRLKA